MYTKNGAIKPRKSIVIYKNGKQIICPTHEMLIADGWAVYTKPEPTAEELFERAKSELKQSIINYDSSNAVNNFFMGDVPMWLDKGTRTGLMLRFQSEQAMSMYKQFTSDGAGIVEKTAIMPDGTEGKVYFRKCRHYRSHSTK